MRTEKRGPEATLHIPPPGGRANGRLKELQEMGYLSLETTTFDLEEVSTRKFAEARRSVAKSVVLNPLHADLKAVAAWFLQKQQSTTIRYEQLYPRSLRRADVAAVNEGAYAEVGMVEDVSRIYEMLGMDVVMRGSSISSVLKRYPASDDPTSSVRAILSIPFPSTDPTVRAWELDELAIHRYCRGNKRPTTPNRHHPWWSD